MKMNRQAIAFLLSAALLLSGCGATFPAGTVRPAPSPSPTATAAPTAAADSGKHYFSDNIRRADVRYADMAYEHYDAARFDAVTAPIYRLAENGGSAAAFDAADADLTDELYYVYTLGSLIDMQYYANPEDEDIAAERLYAEELWRTVWDEYWQAMHTLAVSPHAALLEDVYDREAAEEFSGYEGYVEGELSLLEREDALVAEYYSLMEQDEIDVDAAAELYVELVGVRNALATLYGYDSYAEYAYGSTYCRDYTPENARTVWAGAKRCFAPLLERYAWDVMSAAELLQSDEGLDCGEGAVMSAIGRGAAELSEEVRAAWEYLRDYGLCDIGYDPGKAEVGFTDFLYYYNEPFIFNCSYGEFYDYLGMFHEFGHFVNRFYNPGDLIFGFGDYDLAELQSQGMEIMFTRFYDGIFGDYADAARDYVLLNMVTSVIDGALYDEFQQRVYAEPGLTAARVSEIYAEVYAAYGYNPYDGYETEWIYVSHNFESPFYYLSYAVSALSALELFCLQREDADAALDRYLTICAMDNEEYYFSEAVSDAGLGDVFDADTYQTVAAGLRSAF